MNRYLEKIAELLDHENKQVLKTWGADAAVGVPAAAAGGYLGHLAGSKLHIPGSSNSLLKNAPGIGIFLGSHIAGGLAGLAAMKATMHGNIKKDNV